MSNAPMPSERTAEAEKLPNLVGQLVWLDQARTPNARAWGKFTVRQLDFCGSAPGSSGDQVQIVLEDDEAATTTIAAPLSALVVANDRLESVGASWWCLRLVPQQWRPEQQDAIREFQGRYCELNRRSLVVVDGVYAVPDGADLYISDLETGKQGVLHARAGNIVFRRAAIFDVTGHWSLSSRPGKCLRYERILVACGLASAIQRIRWS